MNNLQLWREKWVYKDTFIIIIIIINLNKNKLINLNNFFHYQKIRKKEATKEERETK